MGEAEPMDRILRLRALSDKKQNGVDYVKVNSQGKVVSGMFASGRSYRVVTDGKIELDAGVATVGVFETGESAKIEYRAEVAILKDGRDKALAALCGVDEPRDYLNRLVEKACNRWNQENLQEIKGSVEERFRAGWDTFRGWIQAEFRNAYGLYINIRPEHTAIPPVMVNTGKFDVVVKDYTARSVTLQLDTVLDYSADLQGSELPPGDDLAWRDRIRELIGQICETSVTLQDYYFNPGQVKETLMTKLDEELKAYRRQVRRLDIVTDPAPFRDYQQPDAIMVNWVSPSGRAVTFKVRADMKLIHDQVAAYVTAGSPDMTRWFESQLEELVKRELLHKDWYDIDLKQLRDLEGHIQKTLHDKAKAIGVNLTALVADPVLPERKYLERFEVKVPAHNYQTSENGTQVRFDMVVTGQLRSLVKAKDLLWRQDALQGAMQDEARKAAEACMRGISPDDYVTKFDRPRTIDKKVDDAIAQETSDQAFAREKIEAAVLARLGERFDFEGKDGDAVSVIPDDSAYKEVAEKIRSTPHLNIPFSASPLERDRTLEFDLTIDVLGPVPHKMLWLVWKGFDVETVKQLIRQRASKCLSEERVDELMVRTGEEKQKLENHFSSTLLEFASQELGLAINVTHFERRVSREEKIKQAQYANKLGWLEQDALVEGATQEHETTRLIKQIEQETQTAAEVAAKKAEKANVSRTFGGDSTASDEYDTRAAYLAQVRARGQGLALENGSKEEAASKAANDKAPEKEDEDGDI